MSSMTLTGVGGSSVINPAYFGANLYAWWDFQSASWLYQDSGITTPVTANNDPIGAAFDRSGNSRHLLQSTPGARPLWKDSLYTWPAGVPDKVDDGLIRGLLPVGNGYELFFKIEVIRSSFPGPTTDDILFASGNGGATAYEFDTYNSAGATGTGSNRFASRNGSNLFLDGASFTGGSAITPGFHVLSSQYAGTASSNLGYYLWKFADSAFFGNQPVYEAFVVSRNCTNAERAGVYTYFLTSDGS